MMTHIELENFLSFPGVQKIGPFHKKFSIRELNDGGKVNLIDAMLFLFGKRSKQLENNKTAELIHRSSRYPNLEYCRVSAHFQLIIDDESSEEIYEVLTDSAFVITRVAYKDHQAEYMLDNRSSRLTNVALVFMQSGIDLENNRYLFLHGDVTKIANLRPKAVAPHELGLLDYADEIFGPDVVSQQYAVAQGRISTPYNNANIGTVSFLFKYIFCLFFHVSQLTRCTYTFWLLQPFDQYEPDGFMDPSLSNQQYSQDLVRACNKMFLRAFLKRFSSFPAPAVALRRAAEGGRVRYAAPGRQGGQRVPAELRHRAGHRAGRQWR